MRICLIIFIFLYFCPFTQEICNNHIDDDLDGLIDCADNECSKNNEGANWYFGDHAALSFATGSPQIVGGSAINTWEGCSVISDNRGQLLFYTDGITIYNKNNIAMLNGSGLEGDQTSTQSGVICQVPGSTSKYYVFTLKTTGIYYSIVDMSLDGGLGAVSQKNTFLRYMYSEKIELAKSCGNKSYWLLTADNSSISVYAINTSGISLSHTISTSYANRMYGYMQVSPSGKYLALADYSGSLELFDFDMSTGTPSNQRVFGLNNGAYNQYYGIEFSLNENFLYTTHMGRLNECRLYQYELNPSATITSLNTSKTLIASTSSPNVGDAEYSALQLAPNGKIYMAVSTTYHNPRGPLSVINTPNMKGSACGFQFDAISLGTGSSRSGLPNFSSYQVKKVDLEGTKQVLCGNEIQLSASGACSYTWAGPNSFTAVGSTASIANAKEIHSGTYTVTMDLDAGCTINKTIDVQVGCTTPLDFLDFRVFPQPKYNTLLKWIVSENNASVGYDVYRSTNGHTFEHIASIQSSNMLEYNYVDQRLEKDASMYYYYIKAKVINSSLTHISSVVALYSEEQKSISICRNPLSGGFVINGQNEEDGQFELVILDLAGTVVHKQMGTWNKGKYTIDLNLNRGIYLIRLYYESEIYWFKIVQENSF
jgi:hypothetical protein